SRLDELQRVVDPISTLPVEISSNIFVQSLPDEAPQATNSSECTLPSTDDAPLLLTRICKKWRTIALSTLKLWSALQFELHGDRTTDAKLISFLDIWLARSRAFPLILSIGGSDQSEPAQEKALVCVLARHAKQWKELSLNFSVPLYHNIPLPDSSLPVLERLVLYAPDERKTAAFCSKSIPPISVFQNAPLLSQIRLGPHLSPSDFDFPWNQMTILRCDGISGFECLEALRQ
ncbi:hypothetical protein C8J57DRAFT_966091, partial [Mycena rebaudengoi]